MTKCLWFGGWVELDALTVDVLVIEWKYICDGVDGMVEEKEEREREEMEGGRVFKQLHHAP